MKAYNGPFYKHVVMEQHPPKINKVHRIRNLQIEDGVRSIL